MICVLPGHATGLICLRQIKNAPTGSERGWLVLLVITSFVNGVMKASCLPTSG